MGVFEDGIGDQVMGGGGYLKPFALCRVSSRNGEGERGLNGGAEGEGVAGVEPPTSRRDAATLGGLATGTVTPLGGVGWAVGNQQCSA